MTTNPQPAETESSSLSFGLKIAHALAALLAAGAVGHIYLKSGDEHALAFLLMAASLLLTSLGTLHMSGHAKKSVVILSLMAAIAGAATYWQAYSNPANSEPRISDVKIDFRAIQYDVKPINAQPCAPADEARSHYVCDVKVTPLKAGTPAPAKAQQ